MITSTPLPLVLAVYDCQQNWLGNFRCNSILDVEKYLERHCSNLKALQPLTTRTLINLNEVTPVPALATPKSAENNNLAWGDPMVHISDFTIQPRQQRISVNFNGLLALAELTHQMALYALAGERYLCQEVFLNTGDWYELVLQLVDNAEDIAKLTVPAKV